MTIKPLTTARRNRRHQLAAAVLLVLTCVAAAALLPSGTDAATGERSEADASAALTVSTTRPVQRAIARSLAAAGSVESRDELLIGSDSPGVRLLDVFVEVGSAVRKGQLLAQGDDRQLRAQLAQQQAMLRQMRAELHQARDQLQRAESVEGAGVYSQELLQMRRSAAEAAAAKLEHAQAQERETLLRIEQASIRAPADGVISRRTATIGLVMQPGIELFRLIRGGELEWRAELPDHAILGVKPGAKARIELQDGQVIEGSVRLIAPTIDARSRNGLVYVSLPRGSVFRPGSHLQGRIMLGEVESWVLPQAAVLSRDGKPFVYVLGQDGTARAVSLQLGVRDQADVEVLGLARDAEVILTGAGFVKEGERVRVAEQQAPGRGARS